MDNSKIPCEIYTYVDGKRIVDNIVPNDIGRVAGAVLVDHPSNASKEAIYLCGPTLTSEIEMCNTIKDLFPKEVKVVQQTPEQWAEGMKAKGVPPLMAQYMIKVQKDPDTELYSGSIPQEGVANIRKYSGYEPTSIEDFVKSQGNK